MLKAKDEELKKAQEALDLLDGKPKKKTLNLKAKSFKPKEPEPELTEEEAVYQNFQQ